MQHPGGEVELAKRGVYWARYLRDGKPIAYAVSSKGEVLQRYVVQHPLRAEMALVTLWDMLDKQDPERESQERKLRLVLPTTGHRSMLEELDVYNMPPLPGRWRL